MCALAVSAQEAVPAGIPGFTPIEGVLAFDQPYKEGAPKVTGLQLPFPAMQSLAKMGLVSISHGERAKVLKLTARSIFQQVDPTAKIMLAQSIDSL